MISLLLHVLLLAEPKRFDERVLEAQLLRLRGHPGEARELLTVVEADAKERKDVVSEGRALQKRGDLQLDASYCGGARTSYDAALKALGQADPVATAQLWNDLGMWAKQCSSPEDEKLFFAHALGLYDALHDQKGVRKVANNLGTAHFNAGDEATASGFFRKAAAAAKELGDDEAFSTCQVNVALMELLLAQDRLGHECLDFSAGERADRGLQRAVEAFTEGGKAALRLGKTPHSLCEKLGSFDALCEPCLIKH